MKFYFNLDSENDLSSKKFSTKPKFSTSMIGSDNNEHFSSYFPLRKILNDYPHEVIINGKNILMSKYFIIYCLVNFEKKTIILDIYLL